MSSEPPLVLPEYFLSRLMANKPQAGFAHFLELWKSSKSLQLQIKHAIINDYSKKALRESSRRTDLNRKAGNTKRVIRNKPTIPLVKKGTISPLKIQAQILESHGNISRKELLGLLEKHKAGKNDLGTYMLVRAWKRSSVNGIDSPDIRLEQITLDYFAQAVAENRADFFEEISDTIRFLKEKEYQEKGEWKHDPGNWWQFHVLLYVLEHPQEKYSIREFVKYFRDEVGTNEMPTTKTLRKFFRSHGIALDSTPGAPKKSKTK